MYHWSLDVKVKPDMTMIFIKPTDEEGILKKNKAIILRKESLAHWFAAKYDDLNTSNLKTITHNPFPTVNPTNLLMVQKVKPAAKVKPKMPQINHVYLSIYYKSKICPLVAECWAQDKGKMGPKNKLFSKVSSLQALTKEMWEKESDEVHVKIQNACQAQYEEAMAEYN
ncbi:hypothetical protein BS47DRAFT_1360254 [Hydnum rufescens UP504]|uniref:Uncharacterized protein n=1 Tax=Hydnum rufescens UP504 TaxID=1448309 RepID=A0A9P6B2S8_9AGAM|nr:hypothetical protein BS47DRAFT_1360254 [Hydnum rufescens UP504]